MDRIDVAERRRRLAVRHGLGPHRVSEAAGQPADPAQVARQLVALHSTDPATVYLSVMARMASLVTPAEIEASLYERRDLIRMLAMRRTVFVVPAESVPVVQASTTDRVAKDQRARLLKLLSEGTAVGGAASRGWPTSSGRCCGCSPSGAERRPRPSCRPPSRG